MFNVEYSQEDYSNKIKDVLKGRSFEDMEDQCPSFTAKTFQESLPFHYLNEKGINALKEICWLLNGVLPKIEYSPTLLSIASIFSFRSAGCMGCKGTYALPSIHNANTEA